LPGICQKRNPSHRVRCEGVLQRDAPFLRADRVNPKNPRFQKSETRSEAQPSHRTLRDGSVIEQVPGNELPGYDHGVPPGQDLQFSYLRELCVFVVKSADGAPGVDGVSKGGPYSPYP